MHSALVREKGTEGTDKQPLRPPTCLRLGGTGGPGHGFPDESSVKGDFVLSCDQLQLLGLARLLWLSGLRRRGTLHRLLLGGLGRGLSRFGGRGLRLGNRHG